MFLQETWLSSNESTIMASDFLDYNFLTTSADMFVPVEDLVLKSGPVWHGTALGWRKSIDSFITKLPVVSNRFCGVKYVDSQAKTSVLLYTTYLPTSGQDEDFLEILSLLSHDIVQNNTENSAVIVGTDSNVSKKSTKRRYEAMNRFLSFQSLKTILPAEEATFHHNNQTSESQVDHVYFYVPDSSNIKVQFKQQLCLKDNPENISSHDVIIGEVFLPIIEEQKTNKDYSSSYTEFTVKKPKWNKSNKEEYQSETAKVLKKLTEIYNGKEFIPTLCEMFSKTMVISAEKHL